MFPKLSLKTVASSFARLPATSFLKVTKAPIATSIVNGRSFFTDTKYKCGKCERQKEISKTIRYVLQIIPNNKHSSKLPLLTLQRLLEFSFRNSFSKWNFSNIECYL